MHNTIILKKGYLRLTDKEYEKFSKGDTIWGSDVNPDELKRWDIEDEESAEKELASYRCTYEHGYVWDIEEYALEYCHCDEDGGFIEGSDYTLAKEAE